MRGDNRLWVQDHYSKEWHWYGSGHLAYSACGNIAIPGSPYVYHTKPDWVGDEAIGYPDPTICEKCTEKWEIRPECHR